MSKTLPVAVFLAASAGFQLTVAQTPTVGNPNFGNVLIACPQGYAYQAIPGGTCFGSTPEQAFNVAPGIDWVFSPHFLNSARSTGLVNANGFNFDPPPFSGLPFSQAALLQGAFGFVEQPVSGLLPGTVYRVSFYLGSRYAQGAFDGNQSVEVGIDDKIVGVFPLTSFTPFTLRSAYFGVATAGPHVLKFVGLNPGDHTAFFSGVSITRVR